MASSHSDPPLPQSSSSSSSSSSLFVFLAGTYASQRPPTTPRLSRPSGSVSRSTKMINPAQQGVIILMIKLLRGEG